MLSFYRTKLGPAGMAAIIIIAGFLVTSVTSYTISASSAKETILTVALPLTSDNVYSEIQRDLLRPVFVSSLMATDTFVREWAMEGEVDELKIRRYLKEIKDRYNAVTSFFVSDRTQNYYHHTGILKKVSPVEPRDAWYYRVRAMAAPYEINVDPDLGNKDTITIFINYKVFDFGGRYLGATGVGLTVGAVKELIERYQQRFGRTIYFCDREGKVVLHGSAYAGPSMLAERPGLAPYLSQLPDSSGRIFEFPEGKDTVLLSARFIPELNWTLMVEQPTSEIMGSFRSMLKASLLICALVTMLVVWLSRRTVKRFQEEISEMALSDQLTGIPNRRAFSLAFAHLQTQAKRTSEPLSLLMVDLDHFKNINDQFGHQFGDLVLQQAVTVLKARRRGWDLVCRWGGEEFLVLLKGAAVEDAMGVAEEIRASFAGERFGHESEAISMTVSIGIAEYRKEDTESSVVARADLALYAAKRAGRNRVKTNDGPLGDG